MDTVQVTATGGSSITPTLLRSSSCMETASERCRVASDLQIHQVSDRHPPLNAEETQVNVCAGRHFRLAIPNLCTRLHKMLNGCLMDERLLLRSVPGATCHAQCNSCKDLRGKSTHHTPGCCKDINKGPAISFMAPKDKASSQLAASQRLHID